MTQKSALSVVIALGSDSDLETMAPCGRALSELGIAHETRIVSAHRTPDEAARLASGARENGVGVIIAAAGMAAHLAGALAARTTLPVIAVPIASGGLGGLDALLSSVQMPKGVPVATVAVNGAENAGILAAQILAVSDPALAARLESKKAGMEREILAKDEALRKA